MAGVNELVLAGVVGVVEEDLGLLCGLQAIRPCLDDEERAVQRVDRCGRDSCWGRRRALWGPQSRPG